MDAIQTFLWTLLVGMASGIATAVLGYLKSCTIETFDNEKFITTVIWGACVGILMGYYGWDYTQSYQFLISMGLVAVIDMAGKVIYRRISSWWASRKTPPTTTTTTTMKAGKPKKKKEKPPVEEEDDHEADNASDDKEEKDENEPKKEEEPPTKKPSQKELDELEETMRKERIAKMKAEWRAKMDAKVKEETDK